MRRNTQLLYAILFVVVGAVAHTNLKGQAAMIVGMMCYGVGAYFLILALSAEQVVRVPVVSDVVVGPRWFPGWRWGGYRRGPRRRGRRRRRRFW